MGPAHRGISPGDGPLDRPTPFAHLRSPELNAAPADQLRLLDVQALDLRLTQLAHRRDNLPEHAEIRTVESQIVQQRDLLVAAQTEEGDTAREQTKAEQDVDQVRQRSTRDQQRLDSGQVTNPRDLESLQSEIASLAKRQDDLETVVLEIMERHESAQARAKELAAALEGLQNVAAEVVTRRDAALAEIDAEAAAVRSDRSVTVESVPADLLKLYEKLREQQGGVGAARLYQRRCEGCRLELNITELNEVRAAAPDTVVRCENCRRILVRTPDSGL
ncbi:hypothetical protein FH715_03775 [Streptomyces sedi]|uniref:Uncharacterized protein n=1 Tax=Streptomyces sedi TaxID=555059 RepID=A0A5C4VCS2_9ACTN|nr:hypothetical protein FH715_03775 [Streptomyces sedi]